MGMTERDLGRTVVAVPFPGSDQTVTVDMVQQNPELHLYIAYMLLELVFIFISFLSRLFCFLALHSIFLGKITYTYCVLPPLIVPCIDNNVLLDAALAGVV